MLEDSESTLLPQTMFSQTSVESLLHALLPAGMSKTAPDSEVLEVNGLAEALHPGEIKAVSWGVTFAHIFVHISTLFSDILFSF